MTLEVVLRWHLNTFFWALTISWSWLLARVCEVALGVMNLLLHPHAQLWHDLQLLTWHTCVAGQGDMVEKVKEFKCLKKCTREQGACSMRNLGPLHTRAKSRDHDIVRAQKKVSKGRPKAPSKSCSVVTDPQVYCEAICDRVLNQMLFQ